MWFDKIPNKQIQFKTKALEHRMRQWVHSRHPSEVIGGLLITMNRHIRKTTLALCRISHVIPFPNRSSSPNNAALPPPFWSKTMNEILNFNQGLTFNDDEFLFLGWFHSHPNWQYGKSYDFSPSDFAFMGKLSAKEWPWSGHFSLLICHNGKRSYRYKTCYMPDMSNANEMGTPETVVTRSYYQSPYVL